MPSENVLQTVLPPDCMDYLTRLAASRKQSESGVGRDFLVPAIRAEMVRNPLPPLRSQPARRASKKGNGK